MDRLQCWVSINNGNDGGGCCCVELVDVVQVDWLEKIILEQFRTRTGTFYPAAVLYQQ